MKKSALILLLCLAALVSSCATQMKLYTGSDADIAVYEDFPAGKDVMVLNSLSMSIHRKKCRHATEISSENRIITEYKYIDYFLDRGYNKCKVCFTEETDESSISED